MKHLRLAYAGKFARTFKFKNFKNPLVKSLHNWIDNLSMKRLSAKFVHVVTTFAYLVLTFAPTVSFATQTMTQDILESETLRVNLKDQGVNQGAHQGAHKGSTKSAGRTLKSLDTSDACKVQFHIHSTTSDSVEFSFANGKNLAFDHFTVSADNLLELASKGSAFPIQHKDQFVGFKIALGDFGYFNYLWDKTASIEGEGNCFQKLYLSTVVDLNVHKFKVLKITNRFGHVHLMEGVSAKRLTTKACAIPSKDTDPSMESLCHTTIHGKRTSWDVLKNGGVVAFLEGQHQVKDYVRRGKGVLAFDADTHLYQDASFYDKLSQRPIGITSSAFYLEQFIKDLDAKYAKPTPDEQKFLGFTGLFLKAYYPEDFQNLTNQLTPEDKKKLHFEALLAYPDNIESGTVSTDVGIGIGDWFSFPKGKLDLKDWIKLYLEGEVEEAFDSGKVAVPFTHEAIKVSKALFEYSYLTKFQTHITSERQIEGAQKFYQTHKSSLHKFLSYYFKDQPKEATASSFIWANGDLGAINAQVGVHYHGRQLPKDLRVYGNLTLDGEALGLEGLNALNSLVIDGTLSLFWKDLIVKEKVELFSCKNLKLIGERLSILEDFETNHLMLDQKSKVNFGSVDKFVNVKFTNGGLEGQCAAFDARYAAVEGTDKSNLHTTEDSILLGEGVTTTANLKKEFEGFIGQKNCKVYYADLSNCKTSVISNGASFIFPKGIQLHSAKDILMRGVHVGTLGNLYMVAQNNIKAQFSRLSAVLGGYFKSSKFSLEILDWKEIFLSSPLGRHQLNTLLIRGLGQAEPGMYIMSDPSTMQILGDCMFENSHMDVFASVLQVGGSLSWNGVNKSASEMGFCLRPFTLRSLAVSGCIMVGDQFVMNNGLVTLDADLSARTAVFKLDMVKLLNTAGKQNILDRENAAWNVNLLDYARAHPSFAGRQLSDGTFEEEIPGGPGFHPNYWNALVLKKDFNPFAQKIHNPFKNTMMDMPVMNLLADLSQRVYIPLKDGGFVSGLDAIPYLMDNGWNFGISYQKEQKRLPTQEEIKESGESMLYFDLIEDPVHGQVLNPYIQISKFGSRKYSSGSVDFDRFYIEAQEGFKSVNRMIESGHGGTIRSAAPVEFITEAQTYQTGRGTRQYVSARAGIDSDAPVFIDAPLLRTIGALMNVELFLTGHLEDQPTTALLQESWMEKRKRKKHYHSVSSTTIYPSSWEKDVHFMGENIAAYFMGSKIKGDVHLYKAGSVHFLNAITQHCHQEKKIKKGRIRGKISGSRETTKTQVPVDLQGKIHWHQPDDQTFEVQYRPGPIPENIKEAMDQVPFTLKVISDEYDHHKDKPKRFLNPNFVKMVSLAVTIAMLCTGFGGGGAFADILVGEISKEAVKQGVTQAATKVTFHTIMHAAVAAGFNSAVAHMISMNIQGLVLNDMNPLKAYKYMLSSDSLKAMLASVTSATLAAGLMEGFEIKTPSSLKAGEKLPFTHRVAGAGINAASSTFVNTTILGQDFKEAMKGAVRRGVANTFQGFIAEQIGSLNHQEILGDLETYVLHGLSGFAVHETMNKAGMAGAVGSIVGEFIGSRFRAHMEQNGGFQPGSESYQQNRALGLSIAEAGAASVAMALGLDVEVAISSAHNVVDNNCYQYVLPALATLGLCIADRYFDPLKKKGEELLKSVEEHISEYVKDARLTPQEKRTLAQAVVNYVDELGVQYNGGQGAQSLAKAASDYVKTVLDGIEAYREMGGANGYALGDKLVGNDRVAAYLSHAGAMGGMVFGLKTALPGKGVPAKGGGKSSTKGAAKSAAPKPKPTAPMNDNAPKVSKLPKAPQDPHTPRQPQKPKKAKDSGGDGQKTSGPERTAKDPEWKKQEGQEWKDKIVGKAQKTGTSGHARKSYEIAIREAKKTNTKAVYLNKGYNKATGEKIKSNRRPDVTVVKKDGKVNVHEVESKTDNPKTLRIRNEEAMGKLPKHMQGTIDIVKPD